MKRRYFLRSGSALAASLLLTRSAFANTPWKIPERMSKPDITSDEGGLWAMMDREETRLRRSPFALRDAALQAYIQDIACKLAGNHCADVRVHLVRNRYFNANMAPNGMMQVWSGLMLRVENEAQFSAILGHELAHYMERHTVSRLRDAKSKAAFGQFLSIFGLPGLIGALSVVASSFSFSRDQERQADEFGLTLMSQAGYDPAEAAKVWANLIEESNASTERDPSKNSMLFATHPASVERKDTLIQLANQLPAGGQLNEQEWRKQTKPFLHGWLEDEIKRGCHEESVVLLSRLSARFPTEAEYLWARGDIFRLRNLPGDADKAIADFQAAITIGREPAETHRGLGIVFRGQNQQKLASASFSRYLELAPDASDALMVRNYLEESNS